MTTFNYDDLTIGTILSENELESRNRQIHDNSLVAVPTGRTAADGSFEYEIVPESIVSNPDNPVQPGIIPSLMGDNVQVTRVPILTLKFDRGLNPDNQEVLVATGSAVAEIVGPAGYENKLRILTGTTINSEYVIRNIKFMNYQAGYEFRFGGTPRWSHLTVPLDVELLAGLFDGGNGYALGFPEGYTEWGMCRFASGGLVEFVTRANFNVDKLDGTGISGFDLDITKGNIYRIRSLYFGYGPTVLQISVGRKWITAHIIEYPNTSEDTNITETYLPVQVSVKNGNNAENYFLEIASGNVSILIDPAVRGVNDRKFSESFTTTEAAGTEIPLIAFRSIESMQLFGMPTAKENRILSDLRGLFLTLRNQNKEGNLLLVIVPSSAITGGTFIPKNTDTSVIEIATDVTSVDLTDADPVFERAVAKVEEIISVITANPGELRGLRGGFTAVLLYTTLATTTDITGTFNWDEQH